MMLQAAIFALCLTGAHAGSLDKASFATEVKDSGKNAFIKFQAPW
jgi:hypothetical protein